MGYRFTSKQRISKTTSLSCLLNNNALSIDGFFRDVARYQVFGGQKINKRTTNLYSLQLNFPNDDVGRAPVPLLEGILFLRPCLNPSQIS